MGYSCDDQLREEDNTWEKKKKEQNTVPKTTACNRWAILKMSNQPKLSWPHCSTSADPTLKTSAWWNHQGAIMIKGQSWSKAVTSLDKGAVLRHYLITSHEICIFFFISNMLFFSLSYSYTCPSAFQGADEEQEVWVRILTASSTWLPWWPLHIHPPFSTQSVWQEVEDERASIH